MNLDLSDGTGQPVYQLLFESISEGVVIVDPSGAIVLANPRAHELFGYEPGQLKGVTIEQLVPSPIREKHVHLRSNFQDAPRKRSMGAGMNLQAQRKDGSLFYVEISLNHFKINATTFVAALITDISVRVEQEKQIRESHRLEEDLKKERTLNEMKSRFVSMASHEFRTPLSTILSSVSLIEKYIENQSYEDTSRHIKRIKNSVKGLTDILHDFLSADKLEEQKAELTITPFDYAIFVREMEEDMSEMCREGQRIDIQITGEKLFIESDVNMLRNILYNLLTNAIKYSGENQVIDYHSNVTLQSLEIVVRDRGIGIPEAEQQQLFSRFFRAHNATNIKGTGLGLYIVKSYLDMLEGSIEFMSKENEGTTFRILIPINQTTAKHA